MFRFNLLILIALLTLTVSCSSSNTEEAELYTEIAATNSKAEISEIEQEVIDAVNGYRASKGLSTLKFSAVAYEFANEHNTYMIEAGKISHDNFGKRSSKLSLAANSEYVSENLGKDFYSAEQILEAWINSPTHKKVMEGDVNYTAVSVTADQNGVLYFTQLFIK
ncbi:CAP domain-containing protein [Aurantibacter crassamenti]|uniref:CAP domain-containing protein n=1 Tax=Aurantibacter crassamenti TaxID=1837375 RepID=UPI00193A1516|nr:CAP domain-containing protein [Aurantibacter crassamenti]MBM1107734.1 CAP domain-containing protein [Aurantibacter crassamenti]